MGRFGRIALYMAMIGPLVACAANGPATNAASRSLSWFNYAAGLDIKDNCQAAAPDRYRWVYNGIYDRQIRTYDLTLTPAGADLIAQARGVSGNLRQLSASQPLGPWDLTRDTRSLNPGQVNQLLAALATDAAAVAPAAGQRLRSTDFYWLVTACRQGNFSMAAFRDDQAPHRDLSFPPLLLALDKTGIAFKDARRIEGQHGTDGEFQLHINHAGDGLVGPIPAF